MIIIEHAKVARREITKYIQEVTNDSTVFVSKIVPIVENMEVSIDLYIGERIDGNMLSREKRIRVFLTNTRCITGRVAIDSPSVIEKIITCLSKDQLIATIV